MKDISEHMCPPFRDQSHQGIRLQAPLLAGGTEGFLLQVNDLTQEPRKVSLEKRNTLVYPLFTRNRSFVQLVDLCSTCFVVFQRHVGVWESHSGGVSLLGRASPMQAASSSPAKTPPCVESPLTLALPSVAL